MFAQKGRFSGSDGGAEHFFSGKGMFQITGQITLGTSNLVDKSIYYFSYFIREEAKVYGITDVLSLSRYSTLLLL